MNVEPAPTAEAPRLQPVEAEPKPAKRPPREPRVSRKTDEAEGEGTELAANEEKITVPLSEALRDQSEELARVINRSRTVRKNRITRNSIIRVALQCFLEDFSPPAGRPVNSEEELLEAARSRRKR